MGIGWVGLITVNILTIIYYICTIRQTVDKKSVLKNTLKRRTVVGLVGFGVRKVSECVFVFNTDCLKIVVKNAVMQCGCGFGEIGENH